MNISFKTLLSLALMLALLPCTQAADNPSIADPLQKEWSVTTPYEFIPVPSARLHGVANHGDKTSAAILQVTCYSGPTRPVISLLTSTDQLGFKPDAYEGPDAQSNGPLNLVSGTRPPHDYSINGVYTQEITEKDGPVFNFNISANLQELHYWTTEEARGQQVTLTVPSVKKGEQPLTALFILPQDNSVLRKVIEPCMNLYTAPH